MNSRMTYFPSRLPWRSALVAVTALALLAARAPAQDGDEDGVLPKHGSSSGSSEDQHAPGVVGLAGADLGIDQLAATQAQLVFTSLSGTTVLDTSAGATQATFLPEGPIDYSLTEESVCLQGDGQVVLQDEMTIKFEAAPEALGRAAYLVVTAADADLHGLLAGSVAPAFVLPIGDLPAVELGQLQKLVTNHAGVLNGLKVSLVYLSLDDQGDLHKAAAGLTPDGASVEIVND
ncbi:MAG TPA: hypothetical protein VFY71_10470 [Planctomycetota bacterium]|nr:hypothetical protein [Planctomycetota bacterium]